MTEDDTFKRLQGLTFREAWEMYKCLLNTLKYEVSDLDDLVLKIDDKLIKYGWTVDRLCKEYIISND